LLPSAFDPIKLGAVQPKIASGWRRSSRARATIDHVPTPMMIEYYRQRSALFDHLRKPTGISAQGLGLLTPPGSGTRTRSKPGDRSVSARARIGGLNVLASSGTCDGWSIQPAGRASLIGVRDQRCRQART